MTQIVLYIVVGAVLLYLGFSSRSMTRRSLRAVAHQLGLEAFERSLDGEVEGYRVTTEHVRTKSGERIVLEIKLHTPPDDLLLRGLQRSRRPSDIAIGPRFDESFLVEASTDERAQRWLTEERQETLIALARSAESLTLVNQWLEIALPSNPTKITEIRSTVEWLLEVGKALDQLQPANQLAAPPLFEPKNQTGCLLTLLLVLVLFFGAMLAALFGLYMVFDPKPERVEAPAEEVVAPVEQRESFVECVDQLQETPDVDTSECEKLRDHVVEPNRPEVRAAERTLTRLELRKALRVDVDPEKIRAAIEKLDGQPLVDTDAPRKARQVHDASITRLMYDSGLLSDYVERESFDRRAALPGASVSVDLLLTAGTTFPAPGQITGWSTVLDAGRCLADLQPEKPVSRDAMEIYVTCGPETLDGRHLGYRGGRLAGLERDPRIALIHGIGDYRERRHTSHDFQIATAAIQLTSPELIPPNREFNIKGVAGKLNRPDDCLTPWSVDDAALDPRTLAAAAAEPRAGRMASRYRLWAARQYRALGQIDEMRNLLVGIQPFDDEALCAAQLETATGDLDAALARLAAIESITPAPNDTFTYGMNLDFHLHLAIAHARAAKGDWEQALKHARMVLEPGDYDARSAAAIVVAVASAELGVDDDLDELYGPIPDPGSSLDQTTTDHPVLATRWFARAARDNDGANHVEARWYSPDDLTLLPGSEWLQLYVASKLVDVDKIDLWLDSLLPAAGFDPFGLMDARLMVAELRGDEKGVARWSKLVEEHRARIETVSDVRAVRMVRRRSPGTK